MNISIKEIDDAILEIFGDDTKVLTTESVYEKMDDPGKLKLVIDINKLFYKETNLLYTKLIFVVDSEKQYVVNDNFMYLYDINCVYRGIDIEDVADFKKKFTKIFKKQLFGPNIKILSEFMKAPSVMINDWFDKEDIRDLSVYGLKYDPKVKMKPCDSLSFNFVININNEQDIELNILKEGEGLFTYNFNFFDNIVTIEKINLNTLVETIGNTLKNNLVKE